YKAGEGYHVVPPPYTGNFMPPRHDLSFVRLNHSIFKSTVSETITSVHESETSASKTSKENMENPKYVRPSAPIIEENFVLTAVATKSGLVLLNAAKQSSPRAAASISTARHVNTAAPKPKARSSSYGSYMPKRFDYVDTQGRLKSVIGCSRHMTGNKSYLTDYQDIDGGFVAFAGSPKGGKITVKGKIRTGKLDFEDVYFVKELKFNLFSVSQMILVTKPHNKTPYELLLGRPPSISFMRPSGCPVTILNTLDRLVKFDENADEGFLVGYSINNKAFRVFKTRTRKVEENLHINFLENKPNVAGSGPEWLFDIDSLTKFMNYELVTAENQTNGDTGIKINVNAGQAGQEKASDHEYILLPLMLSNSPLSSSSQSTDNKDAHEVPGNGDDYLSERNGQ
ncbi:putative ribonuclease H-like domain-containing protein, partial [Tanacetum coccineum]